MANKVSVSINQYDRTQIKSEVRKQISKVYRRFYNKSLNIEESMRKLNKHLARDVVKAYKETLDTVHPDAIEYLPKCTIDELVSTLEHQRIRTKSSEGESINIVMFNRPNKELLYIDNGQSTEVRTPYEAKDLTIGNARPYGEYGAYGSSSSTADNIRKAIEDIAGKYVKGSTIPSILYLENSDGKCIFNTLCIDERLSDETKKLLNLFEEAAEKIDNTVTTPVKALIDKIKRCVSTKRFESELPELINIWPDTVRQRYTAANGDLSEDDLHIKEAINLYTAGKLLDK